MYLSIPLIAAIVVGFLVYGLVLAFSDYPSQRQIDAAPSYYDTIKEYRSTPARRDLTERDIENLRRILGGEEPLPTPESTEEPKPRSQSQPDVRQAHKPTVILRVKDSKEYLQMQRNNAKLFAKKVAVVSGMVTTVVGYVALGFYFFWLVRKQPKERWRAIVSPPQAPGPEYATQPPNQTYGEPLYDGPPPGEPAQTVSGADTPYEPYEPPIDISELDRAYEEGKKKPPTTNA